MSATLEAPEAKAVESVEAPILEVSGLNTSYDESLILRNVALSVKPGSVVCLMGRNGVGKTTTLKSILGLVKADSGSVKLCGEEITGLVTERRARKGIGYVPQGRDIFPTLTVQQNLEVACAVYGKSARDELDRVYELFPVIKEMLKRKGGVLSGGQQQQLAIARALLTKPKLLMLDEPTEGIQPSIIDLIEDTINLLREKGDMAILLVEQSLDFATAVGSEFYIMDRGSIVAKGAMSGLSEDIVKKYLTV